MEQVSEVVQGGVKTTQDVVKAFLSNSVVMALVPLTFLALLVFQFVVSTKLLTNVQLPVDTESLLYPLMMMYHVGFSVVLALPLLSAVLNLSQHGVNNYQSWMTLVGLVVVVLLVVGANHVVNQYVMQKSITNILWMPVQLSELEQRVYFGVGVPAVMALALGLMTYLGYGVKYTTPMIAGVQLPVSVPSV